MDQEETSDPAAAAPPPQAPVPDDRVTCRGTVGPLKENWQQWSSDHQASQKQNPFSQQVCGAPPPTGLPQRGQRGYGRPLEGSMTERRGRDAHTHVGREVEELCAAIRAIGRRGEEGADAGLGGTGAGDRGGAAGRGTGSVTVEFGRLFEHYVTISNKLVGVLLRARRQGLVHFDGEMLWQGQDDRVVITLRQ
ncbi:actin-binding Rho-activating protein-like [Gadus chalcogrammus]|uniref:actin-binding Rho-activating protein-like n=1 Tax=Gadus chalcogrammus TaxID=1042646 RepID=UPI0024C3DB9E|nr:actin-binding Rho-activating protein-like [Gadus chalcogrammus]